MQNDRVKFKEEFRARVYRFALDTIAFVERLPKGQAARIISEQLLRSATSIGANVVEAQGASTRKDYTNFFSYALKSAVNYPQQAGGHPVGISMRRNSGLVFCVIRT
ncbi:MAG: four helix bundle protein [Candidatus Contubernalis sp.]|nr:four helix bundle protein [Candidatus Contubernalis sp.]